MGYRKSISLLLVLLLSIHILFIPAVAFDDIGDSDNAEAIETLSGLAILSGYSEGSFMPDGKITRAEFAVIVTKLTGFEAVNNETSTPTPFADVEDTYWANNYINYVNSMGFMIGNGDGFSPEAEVTVDEVQKVLVEVLGYGFRTMNMGYPDGYRSVGSELGIYSKVKSKYTEPATRGEVAQMAYNCIDIKVYKRSVFGGDKITYSQGEDLLKEYLKIDTWKGVVVEDSLSGLTGPSSLSDSQMRIKTAKTGEIVQIDTNENAVSSYLGTSVTAYTKENELEENELQYIKLNKNGYKSLLITADQFVQFEDGTVLYNLDPDGNGTDKKISVLPSLDIVYNGVYYDGDKASIMNIDSGTLDFADTDDDGMYDLVKIQEKEYIVVDSVSAEEGRIIDKYSYENNIEVDVDDPDNLIEVTKFNLPLTIGALTSGDVVEVVRSKNSTGKKLYKLTVINNQIAGEITSYSDDSVWIGDKEYKLSSYYKNNKSEIGALPTGVNTSFILDSDNRIMLAADTVSTYLYGYFVGIEQESELSDPVIRIFTSGGKMTDFTLGSNVLLDGKSKATVEDINTNLSQAKYGTSVTTKDLGQLIRYKTNKANEIIGIDTARANIPGNAEQDQDELSNDRNGELKWLSGPKSFDGTLMDDQAILFGIPADTTRYDKYTIHKASTLPNSKYQVSLYNIDEIGVAKAAVVTGDSVAEIENDDPVSMIKKLVDTVNAEGDIVKKMYTVECKSASEKELFFTNDSQCFEYTANPLPNPNGEIADQKQALKAGDVVRILAEGSNVRKVERLLSIDHLKANVSPTNSATALPGEINAMGGENKDYSYLLRFVTGRLMSRQDRYIKLGIINASDATTDSGRKELSYYLQDTAKFVVYSENSAGAASVKSASIGDMKDERANGTKASYVFAKSRYGVLQEVFIYNFYTDPWAN